MRNCLFALSQIKWNKEEREWKGHFWKWVFKSPSLCNRWQSHGYWLWMEMTLEMPTHITYLSASSISENEDLLIYSPVSFPALSSPHAPIIIKDMIISSLPYLSSPSFFFYSVQCHLNFTFWQLTFWFTLLFVVILSPWLSLFLFFLWPIQYQWPKQWSPKLLCEGSLHILLLLLRRLSHERDEIFCFIHKKCMQITFYGKNAFGKSTVQENSPFL